MVKTLYYYDMEPTYGWVLTCQLISTYYSYQIDIILEKQNDFHQSQPPR